MNRTPPFLWILFFGRAKKSISGVGEFLKESRVIPAKAGIQALGASSPLDARPRWHGRKNTPTHEGFRKRKKIIINAILTFSSEGRESGLFPRVRFYPCALLASSSRISRRRSFPTFDLGSMSLNSMYWGTL